MNKPVNENYAATVVRITTLVPLENCSNVQAAIIMGNQVVVGKDVQINDIGLYFPVECSLSKEYLTANNLYRKPELNKNPLNKGYFEENGRVRCVKFRGNKSEGLFMPKESLNDFLKVGDDLNIGDCFDELNGIEICKKYVVKTTQSQGGNKSKQAKQPKETKLIENQFRFHEDTSMLYKNLHMIHPNDLISISYKMHGTSGISSRLICKTKLKWYEKIASKLGLNVVSTEYDYIYSSRKVIKNPDLNPDAEHFYGIDIWGLAHERVKEFLQKGMTFYYEIVGYLPSGAYIQTPFDYGQKLKEFEVRIYRITYTNIDGKVFEFSFKQMQDFCSANGLKAVPQLYYGYAKDLNIYTSIATSVEAFNPQWSEMFLDGIKSLYNEKDCYICKNKVPEEGAVIRIEKNEFEAYKCKSTRFYELETKMLDKGESNIEDEN